MRDVLDLNSLKLIEVNIDGKFVVSAFIEPEQQSKISEALNELKDMLLDSEVNVLSHY